jgi:hypothetical protein
MAFEPITGVSKHNKEMNKSKGKEKRRKVISDWLQRKGRSDAAERS